MQMSHGSEVPEVQPSHVLLVESLGEKLGIPHAFNSLRSTHEQ